VSYSGNTSAFQADAVSSILSTRSKNKIHFEKNLFYLLNTNGYELLWKSWLQESTIVLLVCTI
jgi:hypothetical protein